MFKSKALPIMIFIMIVLGPPIFGYRIPLIRDTKLGEISLKLNLIWKTPIYYEILTAVAGMKIDRAFMEKRGKDKLHQEIRILKEGEKVLKSGTVSASSMMLPGLLCKADIQNRLNRSCEIEERCCNLPEAVDIEKAKTLAPNLFYCWQPQPQEKVKDLIVKDIKEYSYGYGIEFSGDLLPLVEGVKYFLTKTGCILLAF